MLLAIPLILCAFAPQRTWTFWQSSLIVTVLSLFIGLRHEVGGDWFSYIPYLTRAEGRTFAEILPWGDPGYNALNLFFASHPFGIYGVNLVCAVIFSVGLVVFCRAQPRPFLALCLSIPYLVIVVAMGYSRQAVAIGIIMPALLALESGRIRPFLALLTVAASFHSTALVMLAFVLPAVPGRSLKTRAVRLLVLIIVGAALAQTFLTSNVDNFVQGYIEVAYQSEGAAIRVAMNLLPAILLLSSPKRFRLTFQQHRLWSAISLTAVGCAIALLILPSNSTAVDRISLYVIPLQLVVGSRLPSTGLLGLRPSQLLIIVLSFCVAVEFVWLYFSNHSIYWLPYINLISI